MTEEELMTITAADFPTPQEMEEVGEKATL